MSLNPSQFFHGTDRADLSEVLPATKHGDMSTANGPMRSAKHAYAVGDEEEAWHWAKESARWKSPGGGQPVVHAVTPKKDDLTPDDNPVDGVQSRAGFDVVKTHHLPPQSQGMLFPTDTDYRTEDPVNTGPRGWHQYGIHMDYGIGEPVEDFSRAELHEYGYSDDDIADTHPLPKVKARASEFQTALDLDR